MTEWKWSGARWWKFDFHTHTPASDDYGSGIGQAPLKNLAKKVRDTICAVMEGGREAFEQRYRRPTLEAPHV